MKAKNSVTSSGDAVNMAAEGGVVTFEILCFFLRAEMMTVYSSCRRQQMAKVGETK